MGVCVFGPSLTHSRSSHRLQCADQSVLPRSSPAGRASGSAPRFPAAARGEQRSRSWSSQRRPVNTHTQKDGHTHAHNEIKYIKATSPQSNKQLWDYEQAHLFHSPHPALKVHADKTHKVITVLHHI